MQSLSVDELSKYTFACSFFAEIFSAPIQEERYKELLELLKTSDWNFNTDKPEIKKAYDQLAVHMENTTQLDMELEYNYVFENLDELKAPPYSSLYLDKDFELFSDECVWVRKFYQKSGLTYENVNKSPDDTVALEFAYIAFLFFNITNNDDDTIHEHYENFNVFMRKHMLCWVPRMLELVQKHDRIGFYGNLAILCQDFVNQMQQMFELKAEERKLYFPRVPEGVDARQKQSL